MSKMLDSGERLLLSQQQLIKELSSVIILALGFRIKTFVGSSSFLPLGKPIHLADHYPLMSRSLRICSPFNGTLR